MFEHKLNELIRVLFKTKKKYIFCESSQFIILLKYFEIKSKGFLLLCTQLNPQFMADSIMKSAHVEFSF